jgi:hypothetical protein
MRDASKLYRPETALQTRRLHSRIDELLLITERLDMLPGPNAHFAPEAEEKWRDIPCFAARSHENQRISLRLKF